MEKLSRNINQEIKDLAVMEQEAIRFAETCRKRRKMLEGVSTPSLPKGATSKTSVSVASSLRKTIARSIAKQHK